MTPFTAPLKVRVCRRFMLILLTSFLLAVSGRANAAVDLVQQPLEIYVEDNADPFSSQDGSGYANDVVRAAFAAVNIATKLVVVPYARCKLQVIEGGVAGCFSMSQSAELAGRVQFADQPLFTVTPIYFENARRPLSARSEAELGSGLHVGIVREYEYPESAMAAQQRGARFTSQRTEQSNLKMLAAGRLDAALVMTNDLTGPNYWPTVAGVGADVRPAFVSAGRQVAYIGFSLQHPDGPRALTLFNRGLQQIRDNGELERIRRRWQSPQ